MKEAYKIPDSLDKNWADMEISLRNHDGSVGLRPLSLKVILSAVGSLVLYIGIVSHGFMSAASIVQKICLFIVWMFVTYILIHRDANGVMFIQYLQFLPNYLSNAVIGTKDSQNAMPYYYIVGIEHIDKKGIITFTDKSVGRLYSVTGSASALLFERDKAGVISAVDTFYRKLKPGTDMVLLTAKAAQNVKKQVKHWRGLTVQSESLEAYRKMELHTIENTVGQEFKSIRQFVLIRGENREKFNMAVGIFENEVSYTSYVFSDVVRLNKVSTDEILSSLYGNKR